MQTITTFLTFNNQAEEAAQLYTSIFKRSAIKSVTHYNEGGPAPAGSVMSVTFELDGQEFIALNGGASFHFTDGVSLFITCETQEEIDMYWEKLSEGGEKRECGWLKDRFGVSWQVVPAMMSRLLNNSDSEKLKRTMDALMKMTKLDIATLEQA